MCLFRIIPASVLAAILFVVALYVMASGDAKGNGIPTREIGVDADTLASPASMANQSASPDLVAKDRKQRPVDSRSPPEGG